MQRSEKGGGRSEVEGEKKTVQHERQERRGGTYGYFCIRKKKKGIEEGRKVCTSHERKGRLVEKTRSIFTLVFH